ncbi:MAG: sigma-70 family RNA polymerase sigma factor [Planctomycetes bacterium]|nr:sigma-70 family RNA polymerase sigma factor [Planctomycetota bacterium]
MNQTDQECVLMCLDGQPEAFRHLVTRYQGRLVSYLTGRLGDREAAVEIAQESFVRAFFALRKLKQPDSFLPWLMGIAGRVQKETYRQRQREITGLPEHLPANDFPAEPDTGMVLRQAVNKLPETYREPILLRYYGGLSCKEISQELGIPLGTVTKRLSRAYALLRASAPLRQQQEGEV